MGKVHADRIIGKEALKKTLRKIWRLRKPVAFTKVGKNVFIIIFST